MVKLPPDRMSDVDGWIRGLLTDLAGLPDVTTELLQTVTDAQNGKVSNWSIHYKTYGVDIGPEGAKVTFDAFSDSCLVTLETLATALNIHLRV